MKGSPPLRFLAVVIGGWAALRTALIAPPWPVPPADAAAVAVQGRAHPAPPRERDEPPRPREALGIARDRASFAARPPPGRPAGGRPDPLAATPPLVLAPIGNGPAATAVMAALPSSPPARMALGTRPPAVPADRWSLSAWAFVREGDSAPLAAAGLLGGSQAGARLAYRLNRDSARPLALSARLSAPLRRLGGAEAALGLDWRPDRRLPVHFLAERRQALGGQGRSAFAVTAYGGIGDAALGPFRIDAYAQAGLVGARSRDPFADGSVRLSLPLGDRVRVGAGTWAAAQPGLSRVDLGPQAALRLPVAGRALTVAADWRLRVAGNAAPGSGPTLTVGTDF